MRALVLERQHELALRDIDLPLEVGPGKVKIKLHTVGVCGSDVHYYTHGKIGPFVVNAPMVLGHEAAGTIVEVGAGRHPPQGRRPRLHGAGHSRSEFARQPARHVQCRPGRDLLGDAADPWRADALRRPSGQLHLQAARQCELCRRRDGRAVRGRHAGGDQGQDHARRHRRRAWAPGRSAPWWRSRRWPAAARASSSPTSRSRSSTSPAQYQGIIPVNIRDKKLVDEVNRLTDGWGADVVFECSGSPKAWEGIIDLPRPGGTIVVVGLPVEPVALRHRLAVGQGDHASSRCSATRTSTTAPSR